jgi:putative transcriptional regulator
VVNSAKKAMAATAKRSAAIEQVVTKNAAASTVRITPAGKSAKPRERETRKPKSDAFDAIQSAAAGLYSVGVFDKQTMREFDETCLIAPIYTASDVQRIRTKNQVSQEVLARYMGITKSTVAKWESSVNTPSPMAQRLLKVIDEMGIEVLAS